MTERVCPLCGAVFMQRSNRQVYCLSNCQALAYESGRVKSVGRRIYMRDYARRRRAAGKTKRYEDRRRRRWTQARHDEKREHLRRYYHATKEAYRRRRAKWMESNRLRHRNSQFERKIKDLPNEIKEMRRALRGWRIWCRSNGYTYRCES